MRIRVRRVVRRIFTFLQSELMLSSLLHLFLRPGLLLADCISGKQASRPLRHESLHRSDGATVCYAQLWACCSLLPSLVGSGGGQRIATHLKAGWNQCLRLELLDKRQGIGGGTISIVQAPHSRMRCSDARDSPHSCGGDSAVPSARRRSRTGTTSAARAGSSCLAGRRARTRARGLPR